MVAKISPGQDFKGQGHYSKVKSRPHNDAYLQLPTNVPNKYEHPSPYGFHAQCSLDKVLKSRSL